jgi:FKBP-type peptidyl-prolyl cis-trans isomerase
MLQLATKNPITFIQQERPTIEPLVHTNFGSGIPYYDDELKMAQSIEHLIAVTYLVYCFDLIAKALDYSCLSDNPVWYLTHKPKKGTIQKVLYPDICISKLLDTSRTTAHNLLLSLEVVSTERWRKEVKDTQVMKARNEYNQVPEFILVYPKASDNRSIECYRHNGYRYVQVPLKSGVYHSRVIKGMSIREIPRDDWKNGEKIEVLFNGEVLVRYADLWFQKKQESLEKERERKRAEQAEREKEKEQKRAEQAEKEKEKEQKRAEQAEKEKEREQKRAEQAEREKEKIEKQLEHSIKKAIGRGKLTLEEIAEDFGVSVDYVNHLKTNVSFP